MEHYFWILVLSKNGVSSCSILCANNKTRIFNNKRRFCVLRVSSCPSYFVHPSNLIFSPSTARKSLNSWLPSSFPSISSSSFCPGFLYITPILYLFLTSFSFKSFKSLGSDGSSTARKLKTSARHLNGADFNRACLKSSALCRGFFDVMTPRSSPYNTG